MVRVKKVVGGNGACIGSENAQSPLHEKNVFVHRTMHEGTPRASKNDRFIHPVARNPARLDFVSRAPRDRGACPLVRSHGPRRGSAIHSVIRPPGLRRAIDVVGRQRSIADVIASRRCSSRAWSRSR
ncbi:hypothetical protein Mapa_013614 [Marchantia paleacea]|nr:hypothetical protein Mapa_013614 [Marchantia paleacea]